MADRKSEDRAEFKDLFDLDVAEDAEDADAAPDFQERGGAPRPCVTPSHHHLSGQFWVLSHLNRGDLRESGVQGCAPAPVLP